MVGFGQAPPNDDFANATVLVGNDVTFSGTLSNATRNEMCEPYGPCNDSGVTVWWSWTATQSTAVVVETLEKGPTYGSSFAVFEGTEICDFTGQLTTFHVLDCNYMDPITNRYLSFPATAGTTYYIRVSGDAQSFTLRLTATNAPVILAQPQSTTIPAGSSAWFGVVAGGLAPLSYQWRFEGTNLPGQTAAILLLETPPTTQAGAYSVVVSNISGVTTSAVANLTISPTDPRPTFLAVGTTNANRFSFVLQGVPGRRYIIEGSTNLVDWTGEPEFYSCCESNPGVVLLTNTSCVFSVTRNSPKKFLRASPLLNPEICIAHLKAVYFAFKLAAIHGRWPAQGAVTGNETLSFFAVQPVCPSGGHWLSDSYAVSIYIAQPYCLQVPGSHFIP
jgi:hypothetical protein